MTKPVYIYGSPVLRKIATDISPDYPNISGLIADMFETMEKSDGVGLAAPQVGLSIRLFVIDATPMADEHPEMDGFRKVFINAQIVSRSPETAQYSEGCLSIPNLREDVERPDTIVIRYVDEKFVEHEEEYSGIAARIIQHEYDHLDGILFTDKVSPIRRQLLKSKLFAISKGRFNASYKYKIA
ncbi:MAG TPA: peptide deformylase [Tenuifilaceae bacterium]|nr:peptide deformylase [Tenuifilaceae bacterium]HPE18873.1 peptide deformylase [Tenuifilaceae bacterium]